MSACFLAFLCTGVSAYAHTAMMACYDNGDNSVTCYGEFSDGSSATAIPVRVLDGEKHVLLEGKMDEAGEFTFSRPGEPFTVLFDAGPGHRVTEKSDNI